MFSGWSLLQDTRSALTRLSHFVRIHAFPIPYSRNDPGKEKYDVLRWLAHNLVITRRIGAFQLLIVGEPESQKPLFIQLIADILRIYFTSPCGRATRPSFLSRWSSHLTYLNIHLFSG
nr:hypothetical protein ABT39_MTgene127 [Picea glauca]